MNNISTDIVEYLTKFISFETTDANPQQKQACIEWIDSKFCTYWQHKKIAGEVEGAPYLLLQHPDPKWLWFAHIDVVPATADMFTLQQDGDILHGRGVKDMKGAALPFLMALLDALSSGRDPNVSVLLTSDEEIAGPTIPTLLEDDLLNVPVAFTPDTGSSDGIVIEHKGVVWAEITVESSGGHGALPWTTQNPIDHLCEALEIIRNTFPTGAEDDWQMTVTPTQLSGSDAQNQIPSIASATLDIRFPPSDDLNPTKALQIVRDLLPQSCTIRALISTDGLQTDKQHPFVVEFQSTASTVFGKDIPFYREHGATDARYFGAAGIPAFLYGPVGGGLHAKDEWVSHSSLVSHYALNEQLL